ncbi:MAG TPA: arginine--tRNA ligase [Acidimicrobiales bacterium]|nr:arginine--tRNA ligase [Acidimicrobiales bacterium]
MVDTRTALEIRLQSAFDAVEVGSDPVLRPSDHADFQANGALALAKRMGRNPRELAEEIVGTTSFEDLCEKVEVSGPGFINLTLSSSFIATQVATLARDGRLGVGRAVTETIVVDYSSPNVAKEMHVGHLRGTVIGDALCRMLTFVGHDVHRENHVGDWGTPFGMLIEHLVDLGEEKAVLELSMGDLDTFYRQARASFDEDESFRERSRHRVVLLQSGDDETLRLWRILVNESVRYFDEVYDKLGVLLTDDDIVAESFYNPALPDVVADLDAQGLLVESDGAQCVFPPGFTNRNGDPLPLIVQKSDGGFGYAATDLAAIRDRVRRVGATQILNVVGSPQAQHFEMVFATAALAGWLHDGVRAAHVSFGSVLDSDRKMFKTRSGDRVRLVDLLDEAVERAGAAIAEKSPEVDPATRAAVARMLGIGAIKYADLSTDRTRDYVFDWERMLAFEGNTAPYLQYAHARIRSIFRRGDLEVPTPGDPPVLVEPAERDLALSLLGFADAVSSSLSSWSPSRLCTYLFDLATTFTGFYETCPVLKAPSDDLRTSRLALSDLTARVLAQGLGLLGIDAPDQM